MTILSKPHFKSLIYKTIGIFTCLLLLFISCSRQKNQTYDTSLPQFEVIINNNPAFQGDTIHGRQVKNVPSILLIGSQIIERSSINVTLFNNQKEILFHDTIMPVIKDSSFYHEFILKSPLLDPKSVHIDYEKKSFDIPIRLHKIYGKVTDFKGNPLSVVFLVNWDYDTYLRGMSDADGNYTLWLPEEKVIHIFIDNATYGKSTLECFIGHEFILKKDLLLDLSIDRMELYNMRSWASFTSFYVYFIPMSLTRSNDQKLNNTREEWPSLNVDRVKLFVNNKEISIKNIVETKDILDYKIKSWRPAYIVSFDLNEILDAYKTTNTVVIKIFAIDSLQKDNGLVRDQGQAFLINPSYD
jgi:hypothetical protein